MTQDTYDVLIVGGGMAAMRLSQQLAERRFNGHVGLVTEETVFGYNRVLLPERLAGRCDNADLFDARANKRVNTLLTDARAIALDTAQQLVRLADERVLAYVKLVLATGSNVRWPTAPDTSHPNVRAFRSFAELEQLSASAQPGKRIAVLGGGLLGLEAAAALRSCGADVDVIHRSAHLLSRQVDRTTSLRLQQFLQSRGIQMHLNRPEHTIREADDGLAVRFPDGSELLVDDVLVCTGVSPNAQLAEDAGLSCKPGVETNEYLETPTQGIYAIGECAHVGGRSFGWVEAVNDQATALAATLCGERTAFKPRPMATHLKVQGLSLFAAGNVSKVRGAGDWTVRDTHAGVYRRLVFKGKQLVGAVLFGDTSASRVIAEAIGQKIDPPEAESMLFATLPQGA